MRRTGSAAWFLDEPINPAIELFSHGSQDMSNWGRSVQEVKRSMARARRRRRRDHGVTGKTFGRKLAALHQKKLAQFKPRS